VAIWSQSLGAVVVGKGQSLTFDNNISKGPSLLFGFMCSPPSLLFLVVEWLEKLHQEFQERSNFET
jgi:hypothetical protein